MAATDGAGILTLSTCDVLAFAANDPVPRDRSRVRPVAGYPIVDTCTRFPTGKPLGSPQLSSQGRDGETLTLALGYDAIEAALMRRPQLPLQRCWSGISPPCPVTTNERRQRRPPAAVRQKGQRATRRMRPAALAVRTPRCVTCPRTAPCQSPSTDAVIRSLRWLQRRRR